MSVLEYGSKFLEFSRYAPAFVADERLKMNHFSAGLKSVRQYASYVHLYNTVVKVERVMRKMSNYLNEQH